MKFNLEKLREIAKPLPDCESRQIEYQIENHSWLLLSVRLALKIRSVMDAQGLCQSELARRMGVSPAQVSKILSGKENLGLKTIAKIESALGVRLFTVESVDETDDAIARERVEYVAGHSQVYVKTAPIARNITSAYAYFSPVSPKAMS